MHGTVRTHLTRVSCLSPLPRCIAGAIWSTFASGALPRPHAASFQEFIPQPPPEGLPGGQLIGPSTRCTV